MSLRRFALGINHIDGNGIVFRARLERERERAIGIRHSLADHIISCTIRHLRISDRETSCRHTLAGHGNLRARQHHIIETIKSYRVVGALEVLNINVISSFYALTAARKATLTLHGIVGHSNFAARSSELVSFQLDLCELFPVGAQEFHRASLTTLERRNAILVATKEICLEEYFLPRAIDGAICYKLRIRNMINIIAAAIGVVFPTKTFPIPLHRDKRRVMLIAFIRRELGPSVLILNILTVHLSVRCWFTRPEVRNEDTVVLVIPDKGRLVRYATELAIRDRSLTAWHIDGKNISSLRRGFELGICS